MDETSNCEKTRKLGFEVLDIMLFGFPDGKNPCGSLLFFTFEKFGLNDLPTALLDKLSSRRANK